jgi:hypothetical protein
LTESELDKTAFDITELGIGIQVQCEGILIVVSTSRVMGQVLDGVLYSKVIRDRNGEQKD